MPDCSDDGIEPTVSGYSDDEIEKWHMARSKIEDMDLDNNTRTHQIPGSFCKFNRLHVLTIIIKET